MKSSARAISQLAASWDLSLTMENDQQLCWRSRAGATGSLGFASQRHGIRTVGVAEDNHVVVGRFCLGSSVFSSGCYPLQTLTFWCGFIEPGGSPGAFGDHHRHPPSRGARSRCAIIIGAR